MIQNLRPDQPCRGTGVPWVRVLRLPGLAPLQAPHFRPRADEEETAHIPLEVRVEYIGYSHRGSM